MLEQDMLWMDDYLLCDYVNNEDIEYFLTEARRYQAANIRLIESPTIKANSFIKDERYNYYEPGTAYSFSTQIGIWDVECLKNYIKPDWSAWDFERKGSLEIEDFEHPLLAPKFYNFPYEEGVRNGKWLDCGVRVCKRNGIVLDFNKRKPMSNFELAWIYFKGGIIECNPNLVLRLQHLFSK